MVSISLSPQISHHISSQQQQMIKLHQEPLKIIRSINTDNEYAICLDHRLGKGGYGQVFKGFNNNNKYQKYAIKVIYIGNKMTKENIEREVSVVSELPRQQNLVLPLPVKIFSEHYFYIIMPLCNGGSLQNEIIRRSKPYSEDEIYYIFYELICGYKVLYENQILHLDIKPANILIHEGRYKLADFGLSALMNTKEADDIKGTAKYMCPEITNKDYKASDKSDVYSLGVLMYMLIYKRHPYLVTEENKSDIEKIREIQKNSLRKPSVIAQFNIKFNDFLSILTGMIQKNPIHRLSFREVYQRMQALPRIKKCYTRISQSYSFHNLKREQSSDTYNIPANLSAEKQAEMIAEAKEIKKLTMSQEIKRIKQQVEMQKLEYEMSQWIESHRNVMFFIDDLTKIFQKEQETIEDQDLRNCIYCGKLIIAAIVNQLTSQIIKHNKVFPKIYWNLFKNDLDPVTYNRIFKDEKYILQEKQDIAKNPRFDSHMKFTIKRHAATEENGLDENLVKYYNEVLRCIFRKKKIQDDRTVVNSVLILKMIDVTQDVRFLKERMKGIKEFHMDVLTSHYDDNVKRLIELSGKVKEEIQAIDFTSELYEK